MKIFKETKGEVTGLMVLLVILALAVVVLAIVGFQPSEVVPDGDEVPDGVVGEQETGAFTLSLANLAGTSVGDDADLNVYLTSPDVYGDYADAYDILDTQGRLVDPYDATINAGSKRDTPTAGAVSFTVTSKRYEAGSDVNTGSDFGIVIIDDGVLEGDYNPEVGKVKINARLNDELTVVTSVVEGVSGYLGSEISLAPRGNISFYNTLSKADNMASYLLDTDDNETVEDEDFDIGVRLNADDTELRDITVYVQLEDDVVDTATLTLDDIEIRVDGVKIAGTTMTEVDDLTTSNVLRKNSPPIQGTAADSILYVVENGQFDLTRINEDNLVDVTITLVDYDADMEAAGVNDTGRFIITLVPSNGHKDSDMAGDDFIFNIDESGTEGYTPE